MPEKPSETPSLQQQTIELGKTLKELSERDPFGTPTQIAASAFASWLSEAGPTSREPRYFEDVANNYEVLSNSNKDLWELFDILENYIEVEDEMERALESVFISLPIAGKTSPQ